MDERFNYQDGALFCEGLPVKHLAEQFGTPLYIYSKGAFASNFRSLKEAFKSQGLSPLICYSVKANSNLSVLNALKALGAGFDVVSGGEIFRAQKIGADPKKVVYAGVGKRREDIEMAIKWGILMFNVESAAELSLINRVAEKLKKKVKVALRVNPDVDARTHAYITTAKRENKFGIDLFSAEEIFAGMKQYKSVDIVGVHLHIGSQITDTRPYSDALKKAKRFIGRIRSEYGAKLKYLNIGGGLGIRYKDERPDSPEKFVKRVANLIKDIDLKLIIEPGRFIAGNSGIFVSKVIYVKKTPAKNFVVIDGAMNDLIRPSLYGAYHEVKPVEMNTERKFVCDIVGPICESGDFLAKEREIPVVGEGDLLAAFSAGAYGFVMASNYNSRPMPAEVMVDKDTAYLIRKRQTYNDLVKLEKII